MRSSYCTSLGNNDWRERQKPARKEKWFLKIVASVDTVDLKILLSMVKLEDFSSSWWCGSDSLAWESPFVEAILCASFWVQHLLFLTVSNFLFVILFTKQSFVQPREVVLRIVHFSTGKVLDVFYSFTDLLLLLYWAPRTRSQETNET